ncbi:MAG: amino acid permease [Cytophagales bacterium]|nr:MAG: amino acid permease [Cytophagales bacterium]
MSSDTLLLNPLKRTLRLRDLTSMGIAAIVGAGIYGTIGNASAQGGPAVTLLFVFTAIACLLSALCYAEFASLSPEAGSAYHYAYISFGELIAWIIGWDLVMEYSIGNIAVAISWSDYFTSFLEGLNIKIPLYLTMDYFTASRASMLDLNVLVGSEKIAAEAWASAPNLQGIKIVMDLPAFLINVLITAIVYIGIKESKSINNLLVLFKLIIILLIIVVGFFYVSPSLWIPFAPNGFSGIMTGASAVFFAYIGFDALATTSEECINPKRDLPKAMFWALAICTILYVLVTLILTGMVPFYLLNVGDPLALVFHHHGLNFLSGIIGLSAIISLATVLLVFQLGQPRIWMSMSRDGLLPPIFSSIHQKFKTPWFSTIVTGIVVGLPVLFLNLTEVTDLCSIGTLFAFTLVCAGILVKRPLDNENNGFKVPYINGRFLIPIIGLGILISHLFYWDFLVFDHFTYSNIPSIIYLVIVIVFAIISFTKQLSSIPVLGIYINLYLMSELGITNWIRFGVWLLIGLIFYFGYSRHHSKLNTNS